MRGLILAALLAGLVAVPALADPAAAAKTTADEPQTFALANVDVVTGSKARLPYRIQDAAAPSAVATVVITTPDGAVVVEAQLPDPVATGARLAYLFTCDLAPGTYQYHVDVVDSLGRPQIAARAARLRVLPIFPQAASIRRASLWLSRRQSYVGFAVIDDRGELRGYHLDRRFASASVVKAMLLVEYLRAHPNIGARMRTTLERMIIVSDNTAASAIFKVVGGTGLNVCARLFFSMDAFVPAQYRTWVRYLFSHITSAHCWGIPQVARPAGWQVFFKGGFMPVGGGIVVHEASRLERRGVAFSLVVLTSGRETLAYGAATLRGATVRVLGLSTSSPAIAPFVFDALSEGRAQ